MKDLLEFGGKYYYIDFDALDKFLFVNDKHKEVSETEERTIFTKEGEVDGREKTVRTNVNEKEINGVRYEVIMNMIQIIFELSAGDDDDDLLGVKRALEKMSFQYKLAFNTLIEYKIIKELN